MSYTLVDKNLFIPEISFSTDFFDIITQLYKKVYKREIKTDKLLGTWDSILKASENEKFSAAKMSRCVKNKTIINDYYYSTI